MYIPLSIYLYIDTYCRYIVDIAINLINYFKCMDSIQVRCQNFFPRGEGQLHFLDGQVQQL